MMGYPPPKRLKISSHKLARKFLQHDDVADGLQALHYLFDSEKAKKNIIFWHTTFYKNALASTHFHWLRLADATAAGEYAVFIVNVATLKKPFASTMDTSLGTTNAVHEVLNNGEAAGSLVPIASNAYGANSPLLADSSSGWRDYIVTKAFLKMNVENRELFDVFVGVRFRYAQIKVGLASTEVMDSETHRNWVPFAADTTSPTTTIETLRDQFPGFILSRIKGRGTEADSAAGTEAQGFPGLPRVLRSKKVEFAIDLNDYRKKIAPHGWSREINKGLVSTTVADPADGAVAIEVIMGPCDTLHTLGLKTDLTGADSMKNVDIKDMVLRQKVLYFNSHRKPEKHT